MIRLLLHNGLRVDEACAADVADLGTDSGHRVLRVTRKGARKARIPLTPATVATLDAYLADRARRGGLSDARQLAGPLLATASGGRLRPGAPVGTGPPPGPRRGHRGLGPAVPALPAALGDHLRARRRRTLHTCRTTPGTRTPAPPADTTTPGTAWTAMPPTRSRPTSPLPLTRTRPMRPGPGREHAKG